MKTLLSSLAVVAFVASAHAAPIDSTPDRSAALVPGPVEPASTVVSSGTTAPVESTTDLQAQVERLTAELDQFRASWQDSSAGASSWEMWPPVSSGQ